MTKRLVLLALISLCATTAFAEAGKDIHIGIGVIIIITLVILGAASILQHFFSTIIFRLLNRVTQKQRTNMRPTFVSGFITTAVVFILLSRFDVHSNWLPWLLLADFCGSTLGFLTTPVKTPNSQEDF